MGRLDRSPKANWVERKGGLPNYIERIAVHLHNKGMAIGHAIATAINAAKKMCASGDLNWPGVQKANAGSRAQACAAVARWNAMKASRVNDPALELSIQDDPWAEAVRLRIIKELAWDREKAERVEMSAANPRGKAPLRKFVPGAAPGRLKSTDPTARTPKGGSIKSNAKGAAPAGGVPKRVSVRSSAAKGHGPSDATKARVAKVRQMLQNPPQHNPRHNLHPGVNTPAVTREGYRKVAPGPQAAKGSDHAAPPAGSAPKWSLDMARPGQPIKTSNTVRAARILKKLRSSGKPRKPKKHKTWKPTRLSQPLGNAVEMAYNPRQPRDNEGKWTDSPGGRAKRVAKAKRVVKKRRSSSPKIQITSYNPKVGPSAAEKISNAAKMFGTGSRQHKAAIKRFG